MGIASSIAAPSKPRLVLITLDALGTIYRLRQPVAVQYKQVAQRLGLRAKVDVKELDEAFRSAFKHHNSEYPNYGKKTLESPAHWWQLVVTSAFGRVVPGGESALPNNLGSTLYQHFSSTAAYEPYPDVKPFLQSMAALKSRIAPPDGPLVLTGVVTNSDPRVVTVLRNMGFRLGMTQELEMRRLVARDADGSEYYDIRNHFDVLATSYEANAEKPERAIWKDVQHLAQIASLTQGKQADLSSVRDGRKAGLSTIFLRGLNPNRWMRIHIGDEYSKDYLGANNAGWQALHLARDGESAQLPHHVKLVKSLHEAAMIVNVMASGIVDKEKS